MTKILDVFDLVSASYLIYPYLGSIAVDCEKDDKVFLALSQKYGNPYEGVISNKIAKQVFEEMAQTGEQPKAIVEAKGLVQISDPEKLKPLIDDVIAKNPDNVAKYKAGNTNLFGFFVGQVLKSSGGKANPSVVNDLVVEKLKHV